MKKAHSTEIPKWLQFLSFCGFISGMIAAYALFEVWGLVFYCGSICGNVCANLSNTRLRSGCVVKYKVPTYWD